MANRMQKVIKEIADDDRLNGVFEDPVKFSRAMLDIEPRWYQKKILKAANNRLVMRSGRRVGKTYTMILNMVYYAFNNPDSDQLVIGPYKIQVDEIFRELKKLINDNPLLSQSVERSVKSPQQIQFGNGARILGLSAGTSSGQGGKSIRGQGADVIYIDEMAFLSEEDINSIMGMQLEDMENIKIWASSTPTGARKVFWNWCTNASISYGVKKGDSYEDVKSIKRVRKEGNGWTEFHYPGWVNPKWDEAMEEHLRATLSEEGYKHEVLAEFGNESTNVYNQKYVDLSRKDYTYSQMKSRNMNFTERVHIMGVDWDKYSTTPQIVVSEYDPTVNKIRVVDRQTVKSSDYTFDDAVNKIIELANYWNINKVFLDRGYGEYQAEVLKKKLGKDIVFPIAFQEKLKVRDPVDRKMVKKTAKHFMITQLSILLEREQVALSDHDEVLYSQLENYQVVRRTSSGKPIYTSEDEHAHDALALTILGFNKEYPELTKLLEETHKNTTAYHIDKKLKSKGEEELAKNFGKGFDREDEDDMEDEPEYVKHMASIEYGPFKKKQSWSRKSFGGKPYSRSLD